MSDIPDARQQLVDAFYAKHGPCCAGCDHWQHINSMVGNCTRSAPVGGHERGSMLGLQSTLVPEAGHIMTLRDHKCGEFADTFDWATLPAFYLRRIGMEKGNG